MGAPTEFLLALCFLIALRLWVTRINLDYIPAIGRSGVVTSYFDIARLRRDGDTMIKHAYDRFQGRLFKVPFINQWVVFPSTLTHIEEIKAAREEDLSAEEAFEEFIQRKYTLSHQFKLDHMALAVRNSLTRNIAAKFDDIRDEIVVAFDDCFPATIDDDEWVPIIPLVAMREIIGRVSNRIFVGLPLCRNKEWLDLNIEFATLAFGAAEKIKKWPELCKPVVGWWYSPYPKAYRTARKIIGEEIEHRLSAFAANINGENDLPNDLVTWIIEGLPARDRNVQTVTMCIVTVNLAAIHNTSNTFSYVLFRLASYPEYAEPMRKEVVDVVSEHGWSKNAMTHMRKLDSFIRESQRLDQLFSFSVRRCVVNRNGFRFSDGSFLPYGSTIHVPSNAVHHDEKYYKDAQVFDGFRFSKMREMDKEDSPKHQMTNTNATNLTFGSGIHVCPGRFFAANEVKAMLAHVLLEYDVKLKHEGKSRGHTEWDFQLIPSGEEILWKKRQSPLLA